MFIKVVGEKCNILIECDKVIESEVSLSFWDEKSERLVMNLLYDDNPETYVYAMNNDGKTIDSWEIYPDGK